MLTFLEENRINVIIIICALIFIIIISTLAYLAYGRMKEKAIEEMQKTAELAAQKRNHFIQTLEDSNMTDYEKKKLIMEYDHDIEMKEIAHEQANSLKKIALQEELKNIHFNTSSTQTNYGFDNQNSAQNNYGLGNSNLDQTNFGIGNYYVVDFLGKPIAGPFMNKFEADMEKNQHPDSSVEKRMF